MVTEGSASSRKGTCPVCGTFCHIVAQVNDGRVVKVQPDSESFLGHLCIRGYSGEPYEVLKIVGEDAEGLYEVTDMEPYSSNVEAVQVDDAIREWAAGETEPHDVIHMPVLIEIFRALIRQSTADVGRENIDGEAVYNAFQKMENVNTMGAFKELSWGPDRRIANRYMKIKQYTKTGLVAVSDWIPMDDMFEKEARGKPGWPAAD